MSQNTENKQTESKEKKQLSILETIAVYSGVGDMSERKITEEQRKKEIAFMEEQRKKAIASSEERRKKDYGEEK